MTLLHSVVEPNVDMVARYQFISKQNNIDGFYSGNLFAKQIAIMTLIQFLRRGKGKICRVYIDS